MSTGEADWLHLSGDEEIVWRSRPHPIALGRGMAIALVATLLGLAVTVWAIRADYGFVAWGSVGLAVLAGAIAAVRYLRWTNTRYVITTAELYEKRGIVSRDVTQLHVDRVQNTTLEQTVVGRTLGYGDLTVYTAGSGDPELTFASVPNPSGANAALSTQLGSTVGPGRSTGP